MAQADGELPRGALIDVPGRGVGTYQRFERKRVGANAHRISFGGSVVAVELKHFTTWSVSDSGALVARP